MRLACRKVPEIALIEVRDVWSALGIEDGYAATAVRYDRPFGGLMPVQLSDAAGRQPHVDAVIVSEIAKSACVTWRAQPPFWIRFGALLNEAQSMGMPPTSVAGGDCAEGNWLPMARLCGPGSVRLPGLLALIAPCDGWSGLPKEAALAALAVITAPAADTASTSRLEDMIASPIQNRLGVGER
jgi:hypothetical protein